MRLARGTAATMAAAVALGALLPAGAVASEWQGGDGARERGELLSAKKIKSYTAAQAVKRLKSQGFDATKAALRGRHLPACLPDHRRVRKADEGERPSGRSPEEE